MPSLEYSFMYMYTVDVVSQSLVLISSKSCLVDDYKKLLSKQIWKHPAKFVLL